MYVCMYINNYYYYNNNYYMMTFFLEMEISFREAFLYKFIKYTL
jgi:hypothetical protein